MQCGASEENLLQTILSVDQFHETIHCSHIMLLKPCYKIQEIKNKINSLLYKIKDNLHFCLWG
jgi:hypothetical protein